MKSSNFRYSLLQLGEGIKGMILDRFQKSHVYNGDFIMETYNGAEKGRLCSFQQNIYIYTNSLSKEFTKSIAFLSKYNNILI